MSQDAVKPTGRDYQVPGAVHEATRSLLRLRTAGDARRVAERLIRELGGGLVPAGKGDTSALAADISFGDGEPLLPAAPPGSAARVLLDRYLALFLLDARQALHLSARSERLAESASTDWLTGLPNRRMLDRALGRLSDGDTVIMIDLDHFKQVNDNFGHAAGDEVLRVFGRVLYGTVRGRDTCGRFGGEEFLIILAPPGGAGAFLRRLRTEWLDERPLPVTFSAGIAASSGHPDETLRLADTALYQAKEAGRDRWIWATSGRPASYRPPGDYVEDYLKDAVAGNRQAAVRLTLDLLDHGASPEEIVVGLLAEAQQEIGKRWYRNEITAADEHLASGVTTAALDTLMGETSQSMRDTRTVVTCAEGDFHSLAAQMLGEALREHGVGATVLGASMPAKAVAEFLVRSGADSLAISCSIPAYFPGTVRLIDAAHRQGIPVIVGGRAFGSTASRAQRLGADAWARTAADAAAILLAWKSEPPPVGSDPTPVHPGAARLTARAESLGGAAFDGLDDRFPPVADCDEGQTAPTRGDLVLVVRSLAAALLVADDRVFSDFLDWQRNLLVQRGVPLQALIAGIEALRPGVEAIDSGAALLLERGRREYVDRLR